MAVGSVYSYNLTYIQYIVVRDVIVTYKKILENSIWFFPVFLADFAFGIAYV